MSDFQWRYHHLQQTEQSTPGSPVGHWQLLTEMRRSSATGDEITEWAAEDLRLFRLANTSATDGGLIAALRSDLSLESAIERMSEHLGQVELDDEFPTRTYSLMDACELVVERERLYIELLGDDPPADPDERQRIYENRRADSTNLVAMKLSAVENALREKTTDLE